ncbi:LAETG motif-containing sortase-dependent surface protein [Streptomyces sp. NPDC059740]|uniref:LAETG motif-containing sortase-dependent surface protein n=1 Tax=Streptomyces sp. NPDC059740 TaxID=3346926 RepID=UPI0036673B32
MISKRGLFTATALGTGAVLLASGPALACSINDFSAAASAACDTSTGTAKAAITVTDKDSSHTPADVSVLEHGSDKVLATVHFAHPSGQGTTKTVLVDWKQGGQWDVRVDVEKVNIHQVLTTTPTAADSACAVAKPTPSEKPTGTPSQAPSHSATPSAAPSESAAAPVAATTAPSPSSSSAALAETGGGSNTGLIAGVAAALIALGGGALVLRRRAAAARH